LNNVKHVVFIGLVWPEPSSSAAGIRIIQLVQSFLKANYSVTFLSASTVGDYSYSLESIGVTCMPIELNHSSFDSCIKELNPDVVVFDRFVTEEQFGWRVHEQCPNALLVLDTEDLHFLRDAREKAVKLSKEFKNENLYSDTAKREIASILRCDCSLIISEYEYQLLIDFFQINPDLLYLLPMWADTLPLEIDELSNFYERSDFLFIGNFIHAPNWDAVLQLKNNIWPAIRKKSPHAKLHIYGAYSSPKVLQLHNEKEGFIVEGRAENLEEVYAKIRVVLAPLRFGAGVKGKLLEAMYYAVPSITTSIGAESMIDNNLWGGEVVDDFTLFVEKAVELYTDELLWTNRRSTARDILKNRFLDKTYSNQFIQHVLKLSDHLESHRNKNFMGAILRHHTVQSVRYLSKWIEEKNRG
jgi:glycosyltransferase involved in cell wall biosynthesis